ncbi:MAG: class C sortase [Clostridiales bacterium]|nr:class C sortase [Clostridiales bacterium]
MAAEKTDVGTAGNTAAQQQNKPKTENKTTGNKSKAATAAKKKKRKKKKKKKSGRLASVLFALIFVVGLGVLLYPTVSDWWNSRVQSRAIANYDETVANMNEEEYENMLAAAQEYNEALADLLYPYYQYDEIDGYEDALSITSDGMMGYITIDCINVKLPLYHGTSEAVMNVGVGHLQGSSLPVGGESTHCVLSAHRGLPSATLFSHLDEMEIGDTFTLTILNQTLTYQVDQILVVEPGETDDIQIVGGEDYCTLLTCTPYGINTHRLLVRGVRVENPEELTLTNEAYQIDKKILIPIAAAPIVIILLIMALTNAKGKTKKKKKNKSKKNANKKAKGKAAGTNKAVQSTAPPAAGTAESPAAKQEIPPGSRGNKDG